MLVLVCLPMSTNSNASVVSHGDFLSPGIMQVKRLYTCSSSFVFPTVWRPGSCAVVYSQCGLTSDLYSCKRMFVDLLVMVRLIIPNDLPKFAYA